MQADTPYDDKILRILTENLLPPVSKNAGFQKGQKWMTPSSKQKGRGESGPVR